MSGRLLTAREVGERLAVSKETVLRWTRRGELPGFRLPGGALRFREEEIDRWLIARATPSRGSVSHPEGRRPALGYPASATPEVEE